MHLLDKQITAMNYKYSQVTAVKSVQLSQELKITILIVQLINAAPIKL
jgi:hypothetical protein